jgi:hypothetical protein
MKRSFERLDSRLRGNDGWADVGLAALVLLVAESDPKDKEIVIRLIMNMLAGVATWGSRCALPGRTYSPSSASSVATISSEGQKRCLHGLPMQNRTSLNLLPV